MKVLERQTGCSGRLEGQGCSSLPPACSPGEADGCSLPRSQAKCPGDRHRVAKGSAAHTCPSCSQGDQEPTCSATLGAAESALGNAPVRCWGAWGVTMTRRESGSGLWLGCAGAVGRVGWSGGSESSYFLAPSISGGWEGDGHPSQGTTASHSSTRGTGVLVLGPRPTLTLASVTRGVITPQSFREGG